MRLGGLEAGGTKMVCLIGGEDGRIERRESFPTLTPAETMPALVDFFKRQGIQALGIGSFGPVALDSADPLYGYITSTPKLSWRNFNLRGTLADALGVPVGFDTDVNAAALAEVRLGAARGLAHCVYYTVGTGIGGGVIVNGRLLHGLLHPEAGHVLLRAHPDDPTPDGFCPSHKGCLEGLAKGPAIEKRWGKPARELPANHPAWALEAHYLAQACVDTILLLSPQRIVLGGGVMHQLHLFSMIHKEILRLLNGYVQHAAILEHIETYIVPPGLGDNAGGIGALMLAQAALEGLAP
ncbi:MAG: ROK family protein [Oscillospiraceae bacterium]|jgi:fructokinase|nr:ROK family protein [Oscillospiraceae bacterium]